MSDKPTTGASPAQHYPVVADIPCGVRFAHRSPPEGWGRISKIAQDAVELETHFSLQPGERVYLTFAIEDLHRFDDVPATVKGVASREGYQRVEIALDAGNNSQRLKESMMYLVNRS